MSSPSLRCRTARGDFSDIAGSLSGTVNGQYWANLLSQKLGYTVSPGEPYYTEGCDHRRVRPAQCADPRSAPGPRPRRRFCRTFPKPNQGDRNFSTSANNQNLRDDKGALRIDANTRWGALSAYYFSDDYWLDNPYPDGSGRRQCSGLQRGFAGTRTACERRPDQHVRSRGDQRTALRLHADGQRRGSAGGRCGPDAGFAGFVDSAGKPGIVPLAPQLEGIENVSFNDFTDRRGHHRRGAGQQHLSVVRRFLQGGRKAHLQIRRDGSPGPGQHQSQCDVQRLVPVPGNGDRLGLRGLPARHRQQLCAGRLPALLPAQQVRRAVCPG